MLVETIIIKDYLYNCRILYVNRNSYQNNIHEKTQMNTEQIYLNK